MGGATHALHGTADITLWVGPPHALHGTADITLWVGPPLLNVAIRIQQRIIQTQNNTRTRNSSTTLTLSPVH